jgi:transposase
MAEKLLSAAGPVNGLLADKAYDTNRLRTLLAQSGIEAVIPSIARRKPMIPYDREAYRQRNLIERMFARLKDSAASLPATTSSHGTSWLASFSPPP